MSKSNQVEERQIIETVLSYCESGDTHLQRDVMKIPVAEYTDPNQLRREMDILFRQFPIIVGHVSQLPASGAFFTHDATGVPMLITRNRDGAIKAFLNVCRHRGARVEHQACGKANTFSCPYHSWTYNLDGGLRGVPKDANFGDIDKAELGLVELPAFERNGLIWVRPSISAAPVDIDAWLAPMAKQLESLDLQSHVVFKEWAVPREMNWHIALEGFQEQYHFCSAHKNTACAAYLDNQGVFLNQYPHVRHSVPLAGIEKLKEQPSNEWSYRKNFMTQNYLFPCNFVQVMTDHIYIHTIIPTGQTSCIFQCLMLIPEAADTDKAQKYWQANYNVVQQVFDEDFVIGESIQAGLNTGANEHFTIGRFESGLQMARQSLNDALAGHLKV